MHVPTPSTHTRTHTHTRTRAYFFFWYISTTYTSSYRLFVYWEKVCVQHQRFSYVTDTIAIYTDYYRDSAPIAKGLADLWRRYDETEIDVSVELVNDNKIMLHNYSVVKHLYIAFYRERGFVHQEERYQIHSLIKIESAGLGSTSSLRVTIAREASELCHFRSKKCVFSLLEAEIYSANEITDVTLYSSLG